MPKMQTAVEGKPNRRAIEAFIYWVAPQHNLDVGILTRQCEAESSFDPEAKSHCGALGLYQLMPATAAELKVDPLDWRQNATGAMRYMARLLKQFGSYDKALAAYNWGMGNLAKLLAAHPDDWREHLPNETQNYLKRILV